MTKVVDPTLHGVLVADVAANPDDVTPRLVLADHLTDLGDDDRAAFWRWAATPPPTGSLLRRPHLAGPGTPGLNSGNMYRWLRPGYKQEYQGCCHVGVCQLPYWLHVKLWDHTPSWGLIYSMHYPSLEAAWLEAERVWCSLSPWHPGKLGLLPELEDSNDGTYDG
jgi:uncharacterized protein (TIGR02996 family)